MEELNWKRAEYDTWDEAFAGLAPIVRQQSLRIATYTQTIFIEACEKKFENQRADGVAQIVGEYADLAFKCGMYHQIGKALVPPEYQLLQIDFTEEEQAVYRKYTSDGRLLAATLQERSERAKEKRTGKLVERSTKNIPWLMIRESCAEHMERADGSGYPIGKFGPSISPIGQIVGIAKELDRLASETKSEKPFEEAFETLNAQSGKEFSKELINVLNGCREKCEQVYEKFIYYTMTLPKTIPLVDKNPERPMGLSYRPMICEKDGKPVAYEATMWFGGISDRPYDVEGLKEIEGMLERTNILNDMVTYFLYEATDTIFRIQNCKLDLESIVLKMPDSFYKGENQMKLLNQVFKDQPVEKSKLIPTINLKTLLEATDEIKDSIYRYSRGNIRLLVEDFDPEKMLPEKLKEFGIKLVRFKKDLLLKEGTAEWIKTIKGMGYSVIAGNADSHDAISWLKDCGVDYMSGTLTGMEVSEEQLIREALIRERDVWQ